MNSAERNDEQILIRLPGALKSQIEAAAKIEGMTSQEWIRKGAVDRLSLLNICPSCGTINAAAAKFCNECGSSLKDSKRNLYLGWLAQTFEEQFGDDGKQLFEEWMNLFEKQERISISKQGKWTVVTEQKPE